MPTARNPIVVIGASTGGVRTLELIFQDLPILAATLIIVQHIPAFISASFCQTLGQRTPMPVMLAEHGAALTPGRVVVAPGDRHLRLVYNRRIELSDDAKVNFVRPSVDVTMCSLVARAGDELVGVLLTGMGADGARGIAHIHRLGGCTIAQDEASCVIYSMPRAAIETGCVQHVLPPAAIRDWLIAWYGRGD